VFSILAISISILYRAKAPIPSRYDTHIDTFSDTWPCKISVELVANH
jgi:hypothetical protein